jgi:hypothetical protein
VGAAFTVWLSGSRCDRPPSAASRRKRRHRDAELSSPLWDGREPEVVAALWFGTAFNILFTEFQLEAAAALALPPTLMAAAHSFKVAIRKLVAPPQHHP